MGRIAINLEDGNKIYIKSINNRTKTLEFTDNPDEAFKTDYGDFFTRAKTRFIRFHYSKKYPVVKNAIAEPIDGDEFYSVE
jgi:hypothetical protein